MFLGEPTHTVAAVLRQCGVENRRSRENQGISSFFQFCNALFAKQPEELFRIASHLLLQSVNTRTGAKSAFSFQLPLGVFFFWLLPVAIGHRLFFSLKSQCNGSVTCLRLQRSSVYGGIDDAKRFQRESISRNM